MASFTDPNFAADVARALTNGGGSSESTVESQHIKAITNLTARIPQNALELTNVAQALTILNAYLQHIRDPRNH